MLENSDSLCQESWEWEMGGGHRGGRGGDVKLFHADILHCFRSLLEESHQADLQNATNKANLKTLYRY